MPKTRILFTGATGYVGGSVLSCFVDHPNRETFILIALVRSPEKGHKLKSLGLDINVVVGSTEDTEVLANLAADADFVVSMTNENDVESMEAILAGLKRRHQRTGTIPSLMHTSSTGMVADKAEGMYASNVVYSDMDVDEIWSLSPATGALNQHVNKPIIRADAEGYVKTYLICPSLIFGPTRNKLTAAGIQNHHIISGMLLRIASECGGPRVVGEGRNICGMIMNDSVAELFVVLFNSIMRDPYGTAHGREGIYFANTAEFTWNEFSTMIGEVLVEHDKAESSLPQPYTKEELEEYFPRAFATVLGSNVRARADRSKSLGWKPGATKEKFLQCIRAELEKAAEE